MSMALTPEQDTLIQEAIQSGLVRTVDEFIHSAFGTLSHSKSGFDREKARLAAARMRELRKGVTLDLRGTSFRELAHIGHKH